MHLAPIGNTVGICSVYNFQILVRWIFSFHCVSPSNAGRFVASTDSAHCKREKKTKYQVAVFCLFMRILPINFDLLSGKGNTVHWNEDDKKIKQQTNLDRNRLRPTANVFHLPDPTFFSLQTTFKRELVDIKVLWETATLFCYLYIFFSINILICRHFADILLHLLITS
jgi:hypothetical protein